MVLILNKPNAQSQQQNYCESIYVNNVELVSFNHDAWIITTFLKSHLCREEDDDGASCFQFK